MGSAAGAALMAHGGVARAAAASSSVAVEGLTAPIEIVDDRWGVPHIRARTKRDAFFGQGYVVARDRLFQIDLAHRRETGRLAEAFGAAFAEHDAAARLFHYQGDIDAELGAVPRDVRACVEAYCAGINARIAEIERDPSLRPLEYRILDVLPLRWDVRALVAARSGSIGGVEEEMRRAKLAALGLLELDAIVAPLNPPWPLAVPEGLDVAALSDADLGVLRLDALPFGPGTPTRDPDAPAERANAGSNGWTVAGSRTATGRPILANDPHLGIGGFGPRHVVHLTAPGLDVIGGGAPGLPGIMQGHTDRFAFGRTNFHIDQQDLFVLALDPADPERYRHGTGWQRFRRIDIEIQVRDAAPRRITVRHAAQGPVVSHDPSRNRATALASVGMAPGGSGVFAMVAINLARDWATLQQAFRLHPSPTNFHYADIDGNHGWHAIGYVPQRRRGDGLMPVPGDGGYDWTGIRDHRALPQDYNPAKGWFASANQNNLPEGWPRDRIPAFSFRDPYRYDRIATVLASQPRHTLADSVALQHDTLSTPALQLLALLPKAPGPAAAPAARMLAGWNARIEDDSAAAALFEIVWRDLGRRMLDAVVPAPARALVTTIAPSQLLARAAVRPDMVEASLAAGWAEATRLLGPDPGTWRWGTLHQVRIVHPLARVPAIAAAFPPIDGEGSGGDGYTVMARWLGGGPGWRVAGGASYLQAIDVGNWDGSVMLNLPGQSNEPSSPHHRDDYAAWIAGRLHPMPFSPAAVDAAAEHRSILRPG